MLSRVISSTAKQLRSSSTVVSAARAMSSVPTPDPVSLSYKEGLTSSKVLLHFTASWCTPCQELKPIIDEVIGGQDDVSYCMVDIDEEDLSESKFPIKAVPTLVFIDKGSPLLMSTGSMSKVDLEGFIAAGKVRALAVDDTAVEEVTRDAACAPPQDACKPTK